MKTTQKIIEQEILSDIWLIIIYIKKGSFSLRLNKSQ